MRSNRARYQNDEKKQEKKAAKRKYMSYEEVPLEDYRDEEPMPNDITKKFLKMFFILFLSVVAVLAVLNLDKLTPDNIAHWFQYDLLGKSEGDGYPTGFSGSTVSEGNFDLISGVPAYCSDTTIAVLNSSAGTYLEMQHSFACPMLSVNGNYGIVYNLDATGYTIIKRDSAEYTGAVKNKIFSADISASGAYAILTESEEYLSKVTVFRSDNLEKYNYSFADYYMNNVSISKDGTRAVLSGVSARNGGIISVIYVLDFTQDNYLQKYEVDDTYIYSVKYLDNGNAYAVGSAGSYFININNGGKTDISYEGRNLTAFTLKRDQGLIMSLSANPDGRDCDLVSYDHDGNKDFEVKTGEKVISIDERKNNRAILSADTVTVFDRDGKRRASAPAGSDSRKIVFCNNDTFYVLGKSRISRLTASA